MEVVRGAGKLVDNLWLDSRSGWRDQATGCWISACTPAADPELWDQYLQGALHSYRRHGVEAVLKYDAVRDGADTTLFFAVIDPSGRVVGGARVIGPLQSPEESHALVEWNGTKGLDPLYRMIANRLDFGVVEVKAAWIDSRGYGRALSRALARAALPIMTLLDVQFVMATAAAHVLELWRSSGGVVAAGIPSAVYPNENYRTKLMWWDRLSLAAHAEPEQFRLMCAENSQLFRYLAKAGELRLAPTGASG
jgi:hypothetical protein